MQTTDALTARNTEAMDLLFKVLNKLGLTNLEIAGKFGVSTSLVGSWSNGSRRMSFDDQVTAYGLFVETLMARWPEDNVAAQQRLFPLMRRLVAAFEDAETLAIQEVEGQLDSLLVMGGTIKRQGADATADGLYALATGAQRLGQMSHALGGHALAKSAWEHAKQVIASATEASQPAPPARRRRGQRTAKV